MVGPTGTVHSLECDPRLVPRLKNHVDLNCLRQVQVHDCGVLDRDLEAAQLFLPRYLGWASVREIPWRITGSVAVRMVTLDGYVAKNGIDPERLSVIKLDAEGAELAALQGASELLRATSAAVLVEYVPDRMRDLGDEPDALLTLMAEAGYEPWAPMRMARGRVRLSRGTEPAVGEDILFLKRSAQTEANV
jgi:FkbM family methyltransferase